MSDEENPEPKIKRIRAPLPVLFGGSYERDTAPAERDRVANEARESAAAERERASKEAQRAEAERASVMHAHLEAVREEANRGSR